MNAKHINALASLDENATWQEKFLMKHRRLIGILIPLLFYQSGWWCLAIKHDYFSLFPDRYILTITMIFGAMVAGALIFLTSLTSYHDSTKSELGMTSEGGGAVAFPVMTLALGIHPEVARDFSLMIQSCGKISVKCILLFVKMKIFNRHVSSIFYHFLDADYY